MMRDSTKDLLINIGIATTTIAAVDYHFPFSTGIGGFIAQFFVGIVGIVLVRSAISTPKK